MREAKQAEKKLYQVEITPLFIEFCSLPWKSCFAASYPNRQLGKHVNICINEADDALLF